MREPVACTVKSDNCSLESLGLIAAIILRGLAFAKLSRRQRAGDSRLAFIVAFEHRDPNDNYFSILLQSGNLLGLAPQRPSSINAPAAGGENRDAEQSRPKTINQSPPCAGKSLAFLPVTT